MMFSSRAVLLGLACLSCLLHDVAAQKVLRLPMKRRNATHHALDKRAAPFAISMQNYIPGAEYFVTVNIGNPPQDIELVVDTGSSDIWVFGPNSCDTRTSICEGGIFDITQSGSARYLPGGKGRFYIAYVQRGSGVRGDYFQDHLGLGGVSVRNQIMAVAQRATGVPTGIMGIGMSQNEASVALGYGRYPNFPDMLVNQNIISTKAYSVYLDDIASDTGMVLFGGYDLAKFRDNIVMLPIQPDRLDGGRRDTFYVTWTSLGISERNGGLNILQGGEFLYGANLDTGTTLTYVPTAIYRGLERYFGVISTGRGSPAYIDCDFGRRYPGQLVYGFGGPDGIQIAVEFDELIIPIYSGGVRATSRDGTPLCAFGIVEATGLTPMLFGQTFLRSAYVLYDLENMRVGLAQTVFDSTRSNVREYSGQSGQDRIVTIQGVQLTAGGGPMGPASAAPTTFTIATVPYPSETFPGGFPTTIPVGPTGVVPLNGGNNSPVSPGGGNGGGGGGGGSTGGSGGGGGGGGGAGGSNGSGNGGNAAAASSLSFALSLVGVLTLLTATVLL